MNKSLKISLLSAASVLTLAACGNGNNTEETTTEPQTEEQATETDQATETNEDTNTDQATETDQADDTNDQAAEQSSDSPGLENKDFTVSLHDAFAIFKNEVGDDAVQVTEVSMDSDLGNFYYEFVGYSNGTEYEVKIDAETEEVVESESESDDLDDEVLNLDNVVDHKEAMTAALEAAGSGYVKDWDLDVENGVAVYDIDVENGSDQKVNAETGEVF